MPEIDLDRLRQRLPANSWRVRLAAFVEAPLVQHVIIALILLNAAVLGMETNATIMSRFGPLLIAIDHACLAVFIAELVVKLVAYRGIFWRNGWNWFDFIVVGIAVTPGAGPWAVLRSLRVLRVLRLLTVVPSLQKVVAAFIHAIPGLAGVMAVMAIFFYTMAVLATTLFGAKFPDWFGGIGASLYSLFQIMTLESWSMGIVRPVMEVFPWAWGFFVPFIVIATFTILNLFIGIIVSTMQELSLPRPPKNEDPDHDPEPVIARIESELADLRARLAARRSPAHEPTVRGK